ncbi:MAG: hypothetical protein PWQ22_415 [Archaeoglobaceae archaeon]|nr:hypothetical protein [Archaeoglobaceae archaeon]MDK2876005.1 hypothetical protein [Archaeoglobaceae archaeon]
MNAVGVDAGTNSYEIFAIKKGDFFAESFESKVVREDPESFVEAVESYEADVYAGLSGYGLPIKKFSQLSEKEILLMTLNLDKEKSIGLRSVIEIIRKKKMNFYTIPGVIHLLTVPAWRKFNKIDMGTSDKLCSAVLAVLELSEEIEAEKQNFILAEVGYGFSSFLAVKNGRIVDGIGGTSGFPGYSSIGSLDAELAYLLGNFPKSLIFSFGVKSFVEEHGGNAVEILAEFVMKGLKAVEVSIGKAEFCLLSGKFAKELERRIAEEYDTRILKGFGIGKQSAQGACVIANAIAGGEFRRIVDHMQIFSAKGTVLDYLPADLKNRILEKLNLYFSSN